MSARNISHIVTADSLNIENITKIFEVHENSSIENVEFSGLHDRVGKVANDQFNSSMLQAKVKYSVRGETKEQHVLVKIPLGGLIGKFAKVTKPFSKEAWWYSTFVHELKKVEPTIETLSPACFLAATNYELANKGCCEKKFPFICWCPCQEKVRAVIVLENLTMRSVPYTIAKNKQIPNIAYVTLALEGLAKFHGSWWLYRHKLAKGEIDNPPFSLQEIDDQLQLNLPPSFFKSMAVDSLKIIEELLKKDGDSDTAAWVRQYRKGKMMTRLKKLFLNPENSSKITTIGHGDYWISNVMFSHDADGKPNSLVIIDYQMLIKTSPIPDILYFIYIYTNKKFRDEYMEGVLRAYFHQLEKYIKQTDVVYSYENFREEYEEMKDFSLIFAPLTMPNVLNPAQTQFSGVMAIRQLARQRRECLLEQKPDEDPNIQEIRQRLMDIARDVATSKSEF